EVVASSEVNVTGILAQLGRGMIQDVSDQMFQRFTDAMRTQLEAAPASATTTSSPSGPAVSTAPSRTEPAESGAAPLPGAAPAASAEPGTGAAAASAPIEVVSFGSALVGRMVARTLRRPAFWLVLAVVLVLLLLWLR